MVHSPASKHSPGHRTGGGPRPRRRAVGGLGALVVLLLWPGLVLAGGDPPLARQAVVEEVPQSSRAGEADASAVPGVARNTSQHSVVVSGGREAREVGPEDQYVGATFRMGAVLPMVESYGENEPGVLLDLGMWFEIADFAVEPRAGVRFDVAPEGGNYFEIPFDITFNYMPLFRDFTPVLGAGVGLHWLYESRYQEMVAGDVLRATSTWERSDSAWGFAAHARAGLLFFRTRKFRLSLSADFTMTFVKLNGRNYPNAANIGLAFIL